MLRTLTLIILGLGAVAWLWVVTAILLVTQGGNSGFGFMVAAIVSAVFLAFALPALILALKRKFLWAAPFLAVLALLGVVLVA